MNVTEICRKNEIFVSTLRHPRLEGLGLPFDKLKPPSAAEGLSLPAGRQGLTLSGACLRPEPSDRLKSLSSIEGLGSRVCSRMGRRRLSDLPQTDQRREKRKKASLTFRGRICYLAISIDFYL
jgi:hypothetical protein